MTDEEKIFALWEELSNYPLWQNAQKALANYLNLLSFADVEEAVVIAAERWDEPRIDRFRYCCGILRNKLAAKLDPDFKPNGKKAHR